MNKYNLSGIFSDLNSESSVIIPKSIKIKNIKSVDTISDATSSFMPQKQGYSDATSSFMPQKGGYSDATSSFMPQKGGQFTSSNKKNNKDIKQLISMLSPTSESNYTANNNDTEQLRDNLFNILQDGGVAGMSMFKGFTPYGSLRPTAQAQLRARARVPVSARPTVQPTVQAQARVPATATAPVPVSPPVPVPVSPRASDTDHTHIIYTCCLIDLNVVEKLADLKEENIKNGKITRIYMNINPFNIWGTSLPDVAFGGKNYKGIKYFEDLFIKGRLLKKNIVTNAALETFDNAIQFITELRNEGIILFDSGDYLLKPFLYEQIISQQDALELIKSSSLLSTPEKKDNLIRHLQFEVDKRTEYNGKRTNDGQIGIPVPYEWYQTHLGKYVACEPALEVFGYKKAMEATEESHPGELIQIKDMAIEYRTMYIDNFKTVAHKSELIRSIEHRRVILELIDKHFPVNVKLNKNPKVQTKNALLNKALKSLIFNPSFYDIYKMFNIDEDTSIIDEKGVVVGEMTHYTYINSFSTDFFKFAEKWFSTYRFSFIAPKVYFDFTGLLYIMINPSNEDILNPESKKKVIDTDKIQKDIIERCIKLKKDDKNPNAENKLPNAYILELITNVKQTHPELEDFTIVTDLEGDDLTTVVTANYFLPKTIKLNIIIQESRQIKELTVATPDLLKFKEETLEQWCNQNRLPSSLLTVDSIISFYIGQLIEKHERAHFTFIPINYQERLQSVHELLDPVLGDEFVKRETKLEFFKYREGSGIKGKILYPVQSGISPNICKVADALLQLYGTDSSLIEKLITYIRYKQDDNLTRKYLKKNIY